MLNWLATQQEEQQRALRIDRFGFIVPLVPEGGSEAADGGEGRRASGAGATTSGRDGASAPQPAGTPAAGSKQRSKEQQAVERLRKWRKMLGANGSGLEEYRRRRPDKLKRRVRKGIPEPLRGLAWHVLSGGCRQGRVRAANGVTLPDWRWGEWAVRSDAVRRLGGRIRDREPARDVERVLACCHVVRLLRKCERACCRAVLTSRTVSTPHLPYRIYSPPPNGPPGGRKLRLANPGIFAALSVLPDDEEAAAAFTAATSGKHPPQLDDAAAPSDGANGSVANGGANGAAAPPGPSGTTKHNGVTVAAGAGLDAAAAAALAATRPGRAPPLDPAVDTSIMRDLNRTYPTHIYFTQRQGPGQRALYSVLRAYAVYDSKVGRLGREEGDTRAGWEEEGWGLQSTGEEVEHRGAGEPSVHTVSSLHFWVLLPAWLLLRAGGLRAGHGLPGCGAAAVHGRRGGVLDTGGSHEGALVCLGEGRYI